MKLQQVDTHHEEVSFVFVFAMCWNLARQKYPESIIQDFEDFLILVNPPRMQYNTTVPSFTLSIEGHTHRTHNHLVCNGGVFVHHCLPVQIHIKLKTPILRKRTALSTLLQAVISGPTCGQNKIPEIHKGPMGHWVL